MTTTMRKLAGAVVAVTMTASGWAAELDIIAKARAYVGTEEALNGLTSVRYTGTLVAPDGQDAAKQTRTSLEIIFQKPERQRITAKSDKVVETTALDAYEGWMRMHDPANPEKWRQTLLGPEQIRRLRANTWENLSFFRGLEQQGGRVEDQGTKEIEGKTTRKIAFIHNPNVIFYRYFDVATGKLVFTETEGGGSIREEGEIVVKGVRFPKRIITTSKSPQGDVQVVTIEFETIEVNEVFPATLFRVPALGPTR